MRSRSKLQGNIDGAYFGTTFPHLFLMTYSHVRPTKLAAKYVPKVWGFKIHPSSYEVLSARRREKKAQQGSKSAANNGGGASQKVVAAAPVKENGSKS